MWMVVVSMLLIGCSDQKKPEAEQDVKRTQPVRYETKKEQDMRSQNNHTERQEFTEGDYQFSRSDQKRGFTDAFTNEESKKIQDHLQGMKDIKQAQVASTDDKIVIGVLLRYRHQQDHDIAKRISDEVQKLNPHNKNVIVYTDDTHWDRMRNIQSKHRANPNMNINDMLDKFKDEK